MKLGLEEARRAIREHNPRLRAVLHELPVPVFDQHAQALAGRLSPPTPRPP